MDGVYIHIPFCKAKCKYCDFNSYAGMDLFHPEYVDALCNEIAHADIPSAVDTVYFGGGTPTIYEAPQLLKILNTIRQKVGLAEGCEITAECNPGTVDYDKLCKLRAGGFNRLSIGLQSTDDIMLKSIGRIHTFSDFIDCFNNAERAGFDNISVDLIYGLPRQTIQQWKKTLEEAVRFKPKHISAYALKIEPGTPFASMKLDLPDEDAVCDMYIYATDFLRQNGYARYEISNFALEGYQSRHNLKYWQCDSYYGFGAGACSCCGGRRFGNIRDVKEYCRRCGIDCVDPETEVILSPQDEMSEFCFLGLRLSDGISVDEFKKRFDCEIEEVYPEELEKNYARGTLEKSENRIYIPEKWVSVSNAIMVDFV